MGWHSGCSWDDPETSTIWPPNRNKARLDGINYNTGWHVMASHLGGYIVMLTCATALMPGCGGRSNDDPSPSTISIADTPDYVIRVADGSDASAPSAITSAVLLDDGLAVLDRLEATVRIYDDSGRTVRSFGRSGEGPGEFRMPAWIGTCGAEAQLAIRDPANGLMMFDRTDELAATIALPAGTGLVVCSGDAVAVMTAGGTPRLPTAEDPSISGGVDLVRGNGSTEPVIADTAIYQDRPLGVVARIAMTGGLLAFGSSSDDIIMVHEIASGNRRTIPLGLTERRPTTEEYDAAIEGRAAMMPDEESREMVRAVLRQIPPPDRIPTFRGMIGGPDGLLWLTTSPLGAPAADVMIVDLSTGRKIGSVTLPRDAEIISVVDDRLAVMLSDQDSGEKMLAVYRYVVRVP